MVAIQGSNAALIGMRAEALGKGRKAVALHLLLTPMLLASSPAKIDLPEMVYDHRSQTTVITGQYQEAQMRTWGGTQTFDFSGRPWDNDND